MRLTKYTTHLVDNGKITLVRECAFNYPQEKIMDCPDKIHRMMKDVFELHLQSEEHLYMLCTNSKMRLTAIFEVSHGSVNCTLCVKREIFQKALLCNAVNIILIHNHPSGDVTPSADDLEMYRGLQEASVFIGINLIDFMILSAQDYFSFAENNFTC